MQTVWKLYLTTTALDEAEAQLEEIGALAQAITPLGEPQMPAAKRPHLIEAYFTHQPIIDEIAKILPPHSDLSVEVLPQLDWVSESQKGLPPVHVAPFFVYGSHDVDACPKSAIGIEINAGEAFGSGHHETTSGCLAMIAGLLKRTRPHKILDVGTGSGILAIALAKKLKTPIIATDIDPIAIKVTQDNARLNHVHPLIHAQCGDGLDAALIRAHAPFELILANILAEPLCVMAPDFARHLTRNGFLIVSGLLKNQERAVRANMRAHGLMLKNKQINEEWVTLLFQKAGCLVR